MSSNKDITLSGKFHLEILYYFGNYHAVKNANWDGVSGIAAWNATFSIRDNNTIIHDAYRSYIENVIGYNLYFILSDITKNQDAIDTAWICSAPIWGYVRGYLKSINGVLSIPMDEKSANIAWKIVLKSLGSTNNGIDSGVLPHIVHDLTVPRRIEIVNKLLELDVKSEIPVVQVYHYSRIYKMIGYIDVNVPEKNKIYNKFNLKCSLLNIDQKYKRLLIHDELPILNLFIIEPLSKLISSYNQIMAIENPDSLIDLLEV